MIKETTNLNLKRRLETLNYVVNHSPFYKKHFDGYDINNFESLPFTTKQDISTNNEAFCCVEKSSIAEYVTTSGTSGDPITIYLTKNDLDRLAENEKTSLTLMDGSDRDLYQLLTTIDKQFMAGIAYYSGIQKMNAGIIRMGPGSVAAQWDAILKYKPTKLIAVPSFILNLLDYAKKNGIDYQSSSVDAIICIGEPIRDNSFALNTLGKKITDDWKVNLFSTYASTEMATAFSECTAQNGGHLNSDLLYLEVLREDGEHAENGEQGEIVVTTFGVEGTPLVRYRTGDIATFWSEKCTCGRETPRLGPIIGRKNELIKYKGTSIYPQAIYNVLNSINGIGLYYIEVKQRDLSTQELTITLAEEDLSPEDLNEIGTIMKAKLKITPILRLSSKLDLQQKIFRSTKRKSNHINFI